MSAEQWARVAFAPIYEVSTEGRVRSWHGLGSHRGTVRAAEPRVLRPGKDKDGNGVVVMRFSGRTFRSRVHHLVLQTFRGPRPEGAVASRLRPGGGDALRNLRWKIRPQVVV